MTTVRNMHRQRCDTWLLLRDMKSESTPCGFPSGQVAAIPILLDLINWPCVVFKRKAETSTIGPWITETSEIHNNMEGRISQITFVDVLEHILEQM